MSVRCVDCLVGLRQLPDASVDAIVTDPPYGLSEQKPAELAACIAAWLAGEVYQPKGKGFMGKSWDAWVPGPEVWRECFRVLKPGGHILAFAGTRTQHLMALSMALAGFEIRDMIAWVYGSGFPKSLDVSKAVDKAGGASPVEQAELLRRKRVAAGLTREQVAEHCGCTPSSVRDWEEGRARAVGAAVEFIVPSDEYRTKLADLLGYSVDERKLIGTSADRRGDGTVYGVGHSGELRAGGNTDAARQWEGWGTALKPALETVTFASKPYTEEQERSIIQSNLIRLEARLWLLSSASAAEKSSTSSQSEYGAACAIAQWSADEITSTRAALCGQMDTSLFEWAATTSLSIVSSWRRTLVESWSDGSTSTTETKSNTTTDSRTLKFSLSQITPSTIIKACSLPGGFNANASTAESHFNASLLLLQSIRTLSATEPAISQAQHEHLGAGVKPNLDPCIMARKPLVGTVAANVLEHGTGALNIDGCRVGDEERVNGAGSVTSLQRQSRVAAGYRDDAGVGPGSDAKTVVGRWPANLIHDGSDEVLAAFPNAPGQLATASTSDTQRSGQNTYGAMTRGSTGQEPRDELDKSAARFFKECAWDEPRSVASTAAQPLCLQNQVADSVQSAAATWASLAGILSNDSKERSMNVTPIESRAIAETVITATTSIASGFSLESQHERLTPCRSLVKTVVRRTPIGITTITTSLSRSDGSAGAATFTITPTSLDRGDLGSRFEYCAKASKKDRGEGNNHPTVKPTALMRYLVRLVTPPGGTVLDPYTGSGSTGVAAQAEGFKFIGFENDPASCAIANRRMGLTGLLAVNKERRQLRLRKQLIE